METFASLREHRIVRINENKDRFIQKNTLLTNEQKQEVLDFFHSHANLEAKVNNGNWNFNIPYEEFKKVMDSVDTEEKRLKKQTKELRKSKGLESLVEGEDYTIVADTPEYIAYTPKNHRAMRILASNMVEPKLWCRSAIMTWSPKEVLPEGEPMKNGYYPGAKWCVAMETDKHWESYTKKGCKFVVVCSKNPETEESLKKICLVYKFLEFSIGDSVTAADAPLIDVQSDYVEAVIKDLNNMVRTKSRESTLEELQKYYNPESKVYKLSKKVISPLELLRLGKLDHPVVWVGNFVLEGGLGFVESLEGCPEKVTGDFDCHLQVRLTSLKGAPKYVGKSFWCDCCEKLTSLEGAPKYVGGGFNCSNCENLASLEGAPEKVGGNFYCTWCPPLITLEGAPREVGGDFKCNECGNLTSLKGAPEKIEGYFDCSDCSSLTSLEGAPEYVGRDFICYDCGKPFDKDVETLNIEAANFVV